MSNELDALVARLPLRDLGGDVYEGDNPAEDGRQRIFGGELIGQSIWAALASVDDGRLLTSLHIFFLSAGRPGVPVRYAVERLRDGRSFSTRHIRATQGDRLVVMATATFHIPEEAPEYQVPLGPDHPAIDSPDAIPPITSFSTEGPFERREFGPTSPDEDGRLQSTRRAWIRARGPVPDDAVVNTCLVGYISDMAAVMGAAAPVIPRGWQYTFEDTTASSLDHTVWFHRPTRLDRWHYFNLTANSNEHHRGLTHGTIHAEDGTLVASVAQQALLRPTT